jgi:hypothetical protein
LRNCDWSVLHRDLPSILTCIKTARNNSFYMERKCETLTGLTYAFEMLAHNTHTWRSPGGTFSSRDVLRGKVILQGVVTFPW